MLLNTQLGPQLLGEICTLKDGHEIWVGKIVQIDIDHFSVKLLEEKGNQPFFEQQNLKIIIETMNQEIHLLDVEIVSQSYQENERILLLNPISDIQFQSKRQGPRLPCPDPIEIYYRIFPPSYHSWKIGSFFNISVGGAQFIGDMYISIGELMEVKLGNPFFAEDEIVISRIVHATSENGKYTFSIQFLNLQDSHKNQLTKYIEKTLEDLKNTNSVH